MFYRRSITAEIALFHWLLIIALAAILIVTMATQLAGAERTLPGEPLPFPPDAAERAIPMDMADNCIPREPLPIANEAVLAVVLEHLNHGRLESARDILDSIRFPGEMEAWRNLVIGYTHMKEARLHDATKSLLVANSLEPDNPLPHYFLGLTRLLRTQAPLDNPEKAELMFCSTVPEVANFGNVPDEHLIHLLAARMDLKDAIRLARNANWYRPILDNKSHDKCEIEPGPAIIEFVLAMECRQFEAKAHRALGRMDLVQSELRTAEEHFDEAARLRLDVSEDYECLAEIYEQSDRYTDAFRAHLKAAARGGGMFRSLDNSADALRDALLEE